MQTEPTKADPPKRKRRRFQFRLRTLMIGVTLLAVACWWIVGQLRIVQGRERMIEADDCEIIIYGDGRYGSKGGIPWVRRLLGDREVNKILTPHSTSDGDVERYRLAFPEADVSRR